MKQHNQLKTITLKEYNIKKYLGLINIEYNNNINDWEDLSSYLNDATEGNLWAYPLEELDYCIEENKNICLVILDNGNKALAELPEEML